MRQLREASEDRFDVSGPPRSPRSTVLGGVVVEDASVVGPRSGSL